VARCNHCVHDTADHTARGGCMKLHATGTACGCTFTSGREHGANPFGNVGPAADPFKEGPAWD